MHEDFRVFGVVLGLAPTSQPFTDMAAAIERIDVNPVGFHGVDHVIRRDHVD
jgi:hypothetical protein